MQTISIQIDQESVKTALILPLCEGDRPTQVIIKRGSTILTDVPNTTHRNNTFLWKFVPNS